MFEKQVKYNVFAFFPTAAGLLALFLPIPAPLRAILALCWLLGAGYALGGALLPSEPRGWRLYLGTLTFAAGVIILGSGIYLLYTLNLAATFLVVTASSLGAAYYAAHAERQRFPFGGQPKPNNDEEPSHGGAAFLRTAAGLLASAVGIGLLGYGASLLAAAATDESIRSPWDVAPRAIFLLFFLAAIFAFVSSHGELAPRAALIAAVALAAFAASIAALSYRIGFGFDPFLHRATEQVIFSQGFISPKPFYYLGQYAAVTIAARLLGGQVDIIDTSLVPVALALVIPCAYYALRRTFSFSRGQSATASLALLALPLSSFAATTPQGFANALFLMAAFLAMPAAAGLLPLRIVALLAVATAAIHPLAGVPLLLFVAILFALRLSGDGHGKSSGAKKTLPIIIALAGAVALPAIFVLNAKLSGTGVTLDAENVRSSASVLEAFQTSSVPTRRFDLYLDFVYGWKAVRAMAILAAAAFGLWALRRRGASWSAWALGAFACLGNFVLLKTLVEFPFLIAYERSNYADRLFELTLFLAAPLMCVAVAAALARVREGLPSVRVVAAILAAAILTSSLYLAYPRRDQYEASRGWSTGAADVKTVDGIDHDAGSAPYVVLANQSVSAAAVRELGFKRYFDSHDATSPEQVFFYPIPTGGALYARFLAMNDARGSRAEALKAMDLAGVDTAYYVVTYYWWDAQRITAAAKKSADTYWTVDGKDFVFKYVR